MASIEVKRCLMTDDAVRYHAKFRSSLPLNNREGRRLFACDLFDKKSNGLYTKLWLELILESEMLKDLIANQKKVFSTRLYAVGQIESIFRDLKSKSDLITAILMLEESNRSLLLFILQDDLYSCYELRENTLSPLPFSDYFKEMSQAQGALHLYLTNPIFFKALLVLAQKTPNIVATTDMINIEKLMSQVEKKNKEAVLVVEKEGQINLFYFRKGKLSDGYFEDMGAIAEEAKLQDQLLLYTYSAKEQDPLAVELYYDLEVLPATDVDDAVEALTDGVEQRLAVRPRLILRQDGKEIEKIVDKGVFTLGRDVRSDWVIRDPLASREHALIKQNADGFYIEDCKSRNGTLVNKEKVSNKKLSDRDQIQIGSFFLVFSEKAIGKKDRTLSPTIEKEEAVSGKQARPPLQKWGLELLTGNKSGVLFEFTAERISLGRGKAHVSVDDPKVSRHHADLEWTGEAFKIIDLKSTNGVLVNDEKVETRVLSANDVITVGDTRLRVVCKE
jgi:pSer/pThr/pTyr-binding forkhead associated (FHA) protein